jgi:outer membrane usher protein
VAYTRALKPAGGGSRSALRLPGRPRDAGTLTRRPAAVCAGLLFALAAPSQAQPKAETLLLDIRVNDKPLAGIARVERLADGRLALPAELWTQARLKPAGQPVTLSDGTHGHVLEAAPGIVYRLDRSRLALDITAPAAAFDSTLLSLRNALHAPTPPPLGAYLNYDLTATRAERSSTRHGAFLEGVGFGRWGALVASSVVRADERTHSTIRLDTYWRTDLPGRMETLVVGDTIGTGGAWSRPVRYGGVRYARDFNLAPGFVTYPTPSISGSAALPSTVDVLINNRRSAQSNVQPGPFELTHVPIVTGAGQMQLVVRDMLGRETVINQSYYIAPHLLAPGLSDFSVEAGALRKNYGTRSNDYRSAFGAGTYRLGITDALTGEVRAEVERNRSAAGAGVTAVVGGLAVVAFAAGYAVSDGERGGHYVASVQRTTPQGGASIAVERSDPGYRPFGAGAFEMRPKDQIVAGGGLPLGFGLTAGLSYTLRTTWEGARFSLLGANVGIALPGNMYASAYASKALSGKSFAVGLNLIVPFDSRRVIAASSTRNASGHVGTAVQATQSVPAGPGWGWRLAGSDSATQRVQGDTTYNSNHAQFTAQANAGRDANAVRLGANGSVGWMSGLAFASRRIDQRAFAVVQVGDLEGVAVSLSNQVVAVTNSKGLALVTGLLPYQLNQLTLDADLLPFDVDIGSIRETVVPYARSGALVTFAVKRSRDALVVLRQPDGSPVPAGARVKVTPGSQEFFVARRGEVYLLGLSDDNRIDVRWKGAGCTLLLKMAPVVPGAESPRIGPLVCGVAV